MQGKGGAGRQKSRNEALETREHRIHRELQMVPHGRSTDYRQRQGGESLGEAAGRLHGRVGYTKPSGLQHLKEHLADDVENG